MKRISKLLFTGIITLSVVFSSVCGFIGCGEPNKAVDKSKSQLYIGNLYAGFGDDWLQTWKTNFEKMHENTVFEEGKKGVQIWVDNQRDLYSGANILNSIEGYTQDMYFTEDPNIYAFVSQNVCANITDIVTEDLTEKYGESGSIEDKMNSTFKECLKLNGDYYILPLNESYQNIIYDIDLFEDRGFFISNKSTANRTVFTKNKDEYSNGPDGEQGTYDDGLPATFTQFYDLLQKIKGSSVVPFLWSGKYHSTYGTSFMTQVWASLDGAEQYLLNNTFNGIATTLVSSIEEKEASYGSKKYDVSTVKLQSATTITKSNGVELQKQAGKFYALQFASNIIKDSTNYDSLAFSPSLSQTGAQSNYLYSVYGKQRVAMLIDGSWWSAEAKDVFSNMAVEYDESMSRTSRRFGIMPIPKATSEMVGQPATYKSTIRGAAFVSAYCPQSKLKLAKEFLQYCFSDEGMKIYTKATDTPMPYKYNFESESEKNEFVNSLTTYGKHMWDNHEKDLVVVAGLSNTDFYINNYSYFKEDWDFRVAIDGYSGKYPFNAFYDVSKITPKQYFEGLYNYHKGNNIWS